VTWHARSAPGAPPCTEAVILCELRDMSTQILPHLSLVVPAYNEARRLPNTLRELHDYCGRRAFLFEVIIVVEPGTDETLALAQASTKTFPQLKVIGNQIHRGKGFAVRTGMLASTGELVFFTDADLSTPLYEIDRALAVFDADRDVQVIVGNRQHPGSQIIRHQSWMREHMGKTFNALVRSLAGIEIRIRNVASKGFGKPRLGPFLNGKKPTAFPSTSRYYCSPRSWVLPSQRCRYIGPTLLIQRYGS
jgi:glycosyltransferase involved in cell wall biosynthesis